MDNRAWICRKAPSLRYELHTLYLIVSQWVAGRTNLPDRHAEFLPAFPIDIKPQMVVVRTFRRGIFAFQHDDETGIRLLGGIHEQSQMSMGGPIRRCL